MKMIQQAVVVMLLTLTTLPLSNSAVAQSSGTQQGDPTDSHAPAAQEAPLHRRATYPVAWPSIRPTPATFRIPATGKAVFLHGFDHFRALQEYGNNGIPPLDFEAFVAQLEQYDHNFLRLWTWEHFWQRSAAAKGRAAGQVSVTLPPHVYLRTGPGDAVDGKPRFDLTAFDPAYFSRLRQRVRVAGEHGIWVSVMLFQGWSIQGSGPYANSVWEGHPLNRQNNVNGVDGDLDQDGHGWEVHTRVNPRVNAIHEAYVKAVIDAVGDLSNVLYEISNESVATADATKHHSVENVSAWTDAMVDLLHRYEREKGYGPHPVGVSGLRPLPGYPKSANWNEYLFRSPAEYVSPNGSQWTGDLRWKKDPPAASVEKVILADTDHIHPSKHGGPGTRSWQWRTFTRGHSMNAVDGDPEQGEDWVTPDDSRTMQAIARYAARVDLERMKPRNDLSSTQYCLADPSQTYIVYQPASNSTDTSAGVPFTLKVDAGEYQYEWFDPETIRIAQQGVTQLRESPATFTPPFPGHAVLFLHRTATTPTE